MSAGKIVVTTLRADGTIGPLIGNARIYPADGVFKGAGRPYLAWSVQSNVPDYDLGGHLSGYESGVLLDVIADTPGEVQSILARLPAAFASLGGTTVAGFPVDDARAAETGDEINGPFDEDDGQAYQGSATISIYWGGS